MLVCLSPYAQIRNHRNFEVYLHGDWVCRAAALLTSGVVLLRLGDAAGGKQRLAKALKLAHAGLQNHQLVTQVAAPPSS